MGVWVVGGGGGWVVWGRVVVSVDMQPCMDALVYLVSSIGTVFKERVRKQPEFFYWWAMHFLMC